MTIFNPLTSPLAGLNLIDASAGTGKTYTICALLLRLLLEEDLAIRQILVVTYTEAAAEDLRDRVRKKLREALTVFSKNESADEFLAALLQKIPDRQGARQRLTEALAGFDEAGIFTIHGFCQRMLRENSFESGALFDTELLADLDQLQREIVEDFWRQHLYQSPGLFVDYVRKRLTPDALLAFVKAHQAKPYLTIIPAIDEQEALTGLAAMTEDYGRAFKVMCEAWPTARGRVAQVFLDDAGLNRSKYPKAGVAAWLAAMEALAAAAHPDLALFDKFEKFSAGALVAGSKANHAPPALPFFELCETVQQKRLELAGRFDCCLMALKGKLLAYLHQELPARKRRLNVHSFDDLLHLLHKGLTGPNGLALARAIAGRYPAALIDEFQDTDPIQYEIFQQIYQGNGRLLFLIGDPKQAIYSFRGADIFAYIRAAGQAATSGVRHTLGTNWRSTPGLITAVNTIFAGAQVPFILPEIVFQPVAAAANGSPAFTISGAKPPPFQLWFVDRDSALTGAGAAAKEKAIPRAAAQFFILQAMAAEIVALLDPAGHQARLGHRALAPGDIAILVRTNREARLTQETLMAYQVPAVLHSMDNLFTTPEAEEVVRLLAALAEPANDRRLKAALATAIMGLNGAELDELRYDETAWEKWLTTFRRFAGMWEELGFIRMFRAFLIEHGVRRRLLGLTDGERRLTNLLHLAEVLHQAAVGRHLNMAGLLKYLADQRAAGPTAIEEHQLRLESDADCVRIVTVHKAKGLEYPVVFCPFAWKGSRLAAEREFSFHRPDESYQLILDLGSADQEEHRRQATQEELAENLRLLYVALTRATHRCYLVWGPFRGAETSAPAYLFHQERPAPAASPLAWREATVARARGLTEAEMLLDLERLVKAAAGQIQLTRLSAPAPACCSYPAGADVGLQCRKFAGTIDTTWRVTSFSALTAGRTAGHYQTEPPPPADPAQTGAEQPAAGTTIFDFPQGTRAGTFFHDLLEHVDLTGGPCQPQKLVQDKLLEYGFGPDWQEAVLAMLDDLRAIPLISGQPALRLGLVANRQRLNELEFYFPLAALSVAELKRLFLTYGGGAAAAFGQQLDRLSFPTVQGFMKGFIDLIFAVDGRFYLVDWKSNFLGNRPADYHRQKLRIVMDTEFYTLQYHIYAVALHQYLGARLPGYLYEQHFGGIFYIFLRGLNQAGGPDFGIYRDLPAAPLIKELTAAMTKTARPWPGDTNSRTGASWS